MLDYLILALAGFFAGALNTVAGGGTFLTFPALVYVGVPIVVANATSSVAVFPGYLGGAAGFRRELAGFERSRLWKVTGLTGLGGLLGSLLLYVSSNNAFSVVVPFLLAFATLVFAYGDKIRALLKTPNLERSQRSPGIVLASVYGGYFNGGLGILLLALFPFWGMRDMNSMNGLKNWLSFVLSGISVAVFAFAGLIVWQYALFMMVMATLGGYLGAPIARAVPRPLIRAVIIVMGSLMSSAFLIRLI